jgi:hypothetical protein
MGEDSDGYRHEFVSLVKMAGNLDKRTASSRGSHEGNMAAR